MHVLCIPSGTLLPMKRDASVYACISSGMDTITRFPTTTCMFTSWQLEIFLQPVPWWIAATFPRGTLPDGCGSTCEYHFSFPSTTHDVGVCHTPSWRGAWQSSCCVTPSLEDYVDSWKQKCRVDLGNPVFVVEKAIDYLKFLTLQDNITRGDFVISQVSVCLVCKQIKVLPVLFL